MKRFVIFYISVLLSGLTYGQDCIYLNQKVITDENTNNNPCVKYTAREQIILKDGFHYSPIFPGEEKIVNFTWDIYSFPMGGTPELYVDGNPYYGCTMSENPSFEDFKTAFVTLEENLANYLRPEGWLVQCDFDESQNMVTIVLGQYSDFDYTGNFNQGYPIQEYKPGKEGTFEAKVDENLVVNVDYIPNNDLPDGNRELDHTLAVNTVPGNTAVTPSGAALYEIPVNAPPGIDGMEPKISVAYNSQSGNGLLGWGFNISGLSIISRTPQTIYSDKFAKGLQTSIDDRYALDGNRLIVLNGANYGSDNVEYGTENEVYSTIISHGSYESTGPQWFEVKAKNGTLFKYGSQSGQLQYSYSETKAIIAWYLDSVIDLRGNFISYSYEQEGLNIYLKKISYGCNKNQNTGNYNTIEFFYEKRSDPISTHYGNVNSYNDRVLYKIQVKNGKTLLRQYNFEYTKDIYTRLAKITESNSTGEILNPTIITWGKYNTGPVVMTSATVNPSDYEANFSNQSYISADINGDGRTDIVGFYPYTYYKNGSKYQTTYAEVFYSTVESNGSISFQSNNIPYDIGSDVVSIDTNPLPFIENNVVFSFINGRITGDFEGDGKTEVVVSRYDTEFREVKFGILGDNGNIYTLTDPVRSSSNDAPAYTVADINNDGMDEIIYIEKYAQSSTNTFPGRIFSNKLNRWINFDILTPLALGVNSYNPVNMFVADYDGDGMQDILVTSIYGYKILWNKGGDNGYGIPVFQSSAYYTDFNSTYSCIKPGDFNGDGLIDFVLCEHNSKRWSIATNNGAKGFTKSTMYYDADQYSDDAQRDNTIVGDFDNDGKSDVLIFDFHDRVFDTHWYSSLWGGYTKTARSTNANDSYTKFYIPGDFDGDGRFDLINYGYDCYNQSDYTQKWRLYSVANFKSINGVVTSNEGMVTKITNGMNQKVNFNYQSIANGSCYTDNYGYRQQYPLAVVNPPFFVVSEMNTSNGIGGNTKYTYKYENAIIHKEGKGFLGFINHTQTNTATNVSVNTYTEFEESHYTPWIETVQTSNGSTLESETVTTYDYTSLGENHIFYYPSEIVTSDLRKKSTVTINNLSFDQGNLTSQKTEYSYGTSHDNGTTLVQKVEKNFGSFKYGNPQTVSITSTRTGLPSFTQNQTFNYNNKGKLESSIVDGLTTSFKYDDFGNISSITAGTNDESRTTAYEYDSEHRFRIRQKNALGHTGETTYDLWGNVLTKKDANGLITTNVYNNWGQLTDIYTPDGHHIARTTGWATSNDPSLALYYTSETKDDLFSGLELMDSLGRTIRKVTTGYNGLKFYTGTTYNLKGQVEEVTDPYPEGTTPSKKTLYTYDPNDNRLKTETYSNGVVKTYIYTDNENQNKVETRYSTGESYTKIYDATGLLTSSQDQGGVITYLYNSAGKPLQITSPGSNVSMTYNSNGRQESLTDPNAGTTTYGYNNFGELSSQETAPVNTTENNPRSLTTILYDKLGRDSIRTVKSLNSVNSLITKYVYDQGEKAKGTLTSISRGDTVTSYSYFEDGLCRLKSETRSNGAESLTYWYDYDTKGRVKTMTYPAGFAITYDYNDYDDLKEIKTGATSIWRIPSDGVNSKGQLEKVIYGNQNQLIYGYDTQERINSIYADGIIDFSYEFNDKQQLNYRDEKYFDQDSNIWKGFREDFYYDGLNRLDNVYVKNNLTLQMGYEGATSYNDRIVTKSDAGTYLYQSNNFKIDQLTTTAGYSPVDQTISYTIDGKISKINEGSKTLKIEYDTDNQRFKSIFQDGTVGYTKYYFDAYEKEVNTDNTLKRHLNYIYAGETLVAIYEQNPSEAKMNYIYTDYLGSLRCVTDASWKIEQRLSFDAWGNRRNYEDGSKFTTIPANLMFARGFTGHEHLDEFGLINMNGRVYDPMIGLFLSPDNYVQDPESTQNLNRYAYCLNNPLLFKDPTGEKFTLLHFLAAGAFGMASWGPVMHHANGQATIKQAIGEYAVNAATFIISGGMGVDGIPGTLNLITSSTFNSMVNNLAVYNGQSDVVTSFGFASFNWTTGELGYLGKKGNSVMENIGYGLGAFMNMSDAWAIAKGVYSNQTEDVNLATKWHSAITKPGNDETIFSWGAKNPDGTDVAHTVANGFKELNPVTDYYNNIDEGARLTIIKNVRVDEILKYKNYLNKSDSKYLFASFAPRVTNSFHCAVAASRALLKAGVFNVPILRTPGFLDMQMMFRLTPGIGSWFNNYYLQL